VAGQVGSHVVMTKPNLRVNLSIPQAQGVVDWNFARADSSPWADSRRIPRPVL